MGTNISACYSEMFFSIIDFLPEVKISTILGTTGPRLQKYSVTAQQAAALEVTVVGNSSLTDKSSSSIWHLQPLRV